MSRDAAGRDADANEALADETAPEPIDDGPSDDEAPAADPEADRARPTVIDLVADELALARAQLDAGLVGLAEGTVRRRLDRLEAEEAIQGDEPDALRVLLAEALWRQGRLAAARVALDAIRPGSPQRRLPVALLVEAEALAAAGERDRATGAMERVVAAIGIDAVHELRADAPSRLGWPLPAALAPRPARAPRAPWGGEPTGPVAPREAELDDERIAAARARLEEARVAFVAGERERGDAELSIAVRLDPSLAADGVAILEPTLGGQAPTERLLLYGDLLRAAGREVEAAEAYDRAAGQRS